MSRKTDCPWKDRRHILWFPITFDKYRVENGRLYCQHGLFSLREHECLLYRILDISLTRTLGNRICGTGMCPVGVATQDPEVRARLKGDAGARRVGNFLNATLEELKMFARITGHENLHDLSVDDLCTISREISEHTNIPHA